VHGSEDRIGQSGVREIVHDAEFARSLGAVVDRRETVYRQNHAHTTRAENLTQSFMKRLVGSLPAIPSIKLGELLVSGNQERLGRLRNSTFRFGRAIAVVNQSRDRSGHEVAFEQAPHLACDTNGTGIPCDMARARGTIET